VVFFDVGQVNPREWSLDPGSWRAGPGQVETDSLGFRYTAGFGVRYRTPIGPLRLDIGFKLNQPGPLANGYAIHLSIGQAF
jgi:outer membrane translocation and assembly module TamA